jgi:ribosomal protein L40E
LTSVNVVSIGFDVPNVEVGLLLRPTKSLALHHQQIGRVMRVAEGKEYGIILDQAGNCKRHGFPEDVDEYTLRPSKKAEAGEAPIKECPECSALLPTFAVVCPHCGYEFPIPEKVTETGELVELIPESKVRGKSERDYRKMLQTAFRNGYDPKWAWHRFREKYGHAPLKGWEYGAIFGDDATENIANYYFYLVEIADRLSRDKAWIIDRLSREFGRDNAYAFAVCLQGETLQINTTEVNEYA